MIEHAIAVVGGGIVLAWGIARSLDRFSPSLKTRERMVHAVIEHPDGVGYMSVSHPACPDTADELIERIDSGKVAGK